MVSAFLSIDPFKAAYGISSTPSVKLANMRGSGLPVSETSIAPAPSSYKNDACKFLTQEDVSPAPEVIVITAESSNMGRICTYTIANLKIGFSKTGNLFHQEDYYHE